MLYNISISSKSEAATSQGFLVGQYFFSCYLDIADMDSKYYIFYSDYPASRIINSLKKIEQFSSNIIKM